MVWRPFDSLCSRWFMAYGSPARETLEARRPAVGLAALGLPKVLVGGLESSHASGSLAGRVSRAAQGCAKRFMVEELSRYGVLRQLLQLQEDFLSLPKTKDRG